MPIDLEMQSSTRLSADPRVGWAVVGLGYLSREWIGPALVRSDTSRLAAVVAGPGDDVEAWQRGHQSAERQVHELSSFDRMLEDPRVEVVCVVLPNALHAEFTVRALAAGKHVFCEKPMAVGSGECRRMMAAAEAAGRQLGVGYRCRLDARFRACVRAAAEREFGRLLLVEGGLGIEVGEPGQWRLRRDLAGGGAMMDVGIYLIQVARALAGEEPVEVHAMAHRADAGKFAEVEETVAWTMRFPSGVLASLTTSYAGTGPNYFRAQAERGHFGMDPAFSYCGNRAFCSRPGHFDGLGEADHFLTQIDAFAQTVRGGGIYPFGGGEGLRDLLVIEALYRSLREGRPVVPELP